MYVAEPISESVLVREDRNSNARIRRSKTTKIALQYYIMLAHEIFSFQMRLSVLHIQFYHFLLI
jgi:hypothetical protein